MNDFAARVEYRKFASMIKTLMQFGRPDGRGGIHLTAESVAIVNLKLSQLPDADLVKKETAFALTRAHDYPPDKVEES